MDIYKLYRNFWDFAFDNPEKIKPTHIAIYSFAIEHCNRLGWKQKFGLPSSMVIEAIGIKSYSVYKKCFDELVNYGFFEVIEYSKNQYSSNIIALKENYKAPYKALDKALTKHVSKHLQSTCESIDSIDKQIYNNTNLPIYNNKEEIEIFKIDEKLIFPNAENLDIELPSNELFNCKVLISNLTIPKVFSKDEDIRGLWTVFKAIRFNGQNQYYGWNKVYEHFKNDIKSQIQTKKIYKDGKTVNGNNDETKLGTSEARVAALKKW